MSSAASSAPPAGPPPKRAAAVAAAAFVAANIAADAALEKPKEPLTKGAGIGVIVAGIDAAAQRAGPAAKLVALPDNFQPTPEEQDLLQLYKTIKQWEKEAARLRERSAKARLAAADEKYKKSKKTPDDDGYPPHHATDGKENGDELDSSKKKRKKKKRLRTEDDYDHGDDDAPFGMDDNDDDNVHGNDDEEDDDEEEEDEEERWRAEIEAKKAKKQAEEERAAAAKAEEEELRAKHLSEASSTIGEDVSLKKKRKLWEEQSQSGLLSSIEGAAQATPPHEFSRRAGFKSGLAGRVLFPRPSDEDPEDGWSPPLDASDPMEGCLELELADFDPSKSNGSNTIAVKYFAPSDSRRFSLNITGPNHDDYSHIWFHFNPRTSAKRGGGQLVLNDKQEGIWGQSVSTHLHQLPVSLFDSDAAKTLVIQITPQAFEVYVEGRHVTRLPHRTPLPPSSSKLHLQFPSTDDYRSPENWTVYRVWWGYKSHMGKDASRGGADGGGDGGGESGAVGGSSNNRNSNKSNNHSGSNHPMHPRKLFLSGLSKVGTDEAEIDERKRTMEEAFARYGGPGGPSELPAVTVPPNSTFCFVEVYSEGQADLALQEESSRYRMSRARKSKQELRQERRPRKSRDEEDTVHNKYNNTVSSSRPYATEQDDHDNNDDDEDDGGEWD